MPSALTVIGPSVFADCSSLANVVIPVGVTSIDTFAFRNCMRLRSITFPATLSRIGSFAFDGCRYYFRSAIFEGDAEWRISGSESTFIPDDGREAATCLRETYVTEVWLRVD